MSDDSKVRLGPLFVIGVFVALALLGVWFMSGLILQLKIMGTYLVGILSGVSLLIWLLAFSGLTARARLLPMAAFATVLALTFATVRVRGVTGDWIPVVEWRWSETASWRDAGTADAGQLAQTDVIDLTAPAAFSRFLGSNGDSTITGIELARDWQARPPELLWKRPIGSGWGGFSIVGGIAYTMEQRDEIEAVVAYRLDTGEEIWSDGREVLFSNPIAGPGPRTTPTISQTTVFTFGATGILAAHDRVTGKLLWRRDVVAETGATIPEHGKTSSPLLVDDLVVVSPGGRDGKSLAAYAQIDGSEVWSGGDDASGYGSPYLTELLGERQILVFNASSVAGHSPDDGRVLWSHPWPPDWPNVAPPVVVGQDRVMFSTGYGIGSKLIQLTHHGKEIKAELVWETPRMKAKFTNLVLHDGFIYGLDDGVLTCLDPNNGERRWKRGRYGHGNILLVGDLLLVQTERGDMVLIEPHSEEHRELGRFTALRGKAWNHFALIENELLVRNDREAALWRLPIASSSWKGATQP